MVSFTNIVLVLVDRHTKSLRFINSSFDSFDRFKYSKYDQDLSILIGCSNIVVARAIKTSLEAICFQDLSKNVSQTQFDAQAIHKVKDILGVFSKHLNTVKLLTFDSVKEYEGSRNELLYFSLNFFKVFDEIIRQIDELIEGGAEFEKVKKVAIKSIIYNRTLNILNEVNLSWVYNSNGNIIIDYSGLIEWKSIGVFPTHRRLVELKYFL